MAVGARGKDVMRQFLFEAVAISVAGGLVGIIVGVIGVDRHRADRCTGRRSCRRLSVLLAFGVVGGGRRVLRLVSGAAAPRARSDRRPAPRVAGPKPQARKTSPCFAFLCQRADRLAGARPQSTAHGADHARRGHRRRRRDRDGGARHRARADRWRRSLKSAGTNIIQVSAGNFTRGGESMNIASGLGGADHAHRATTPTRSATSTACRHVAGGVRNRAFVKASAAPPVLHAGPGRRAVAGRHPRLGLARAGFTRRRRRARRRGDGPRRQRASCSARASIRSASTVTIGDRAFEVVGILPHRRRRHGRGGVRAASRPGRR